MIIVSELKYLELDKNVRDERLPLTRNSVGKVVSTLKFANVEWSLVTFKQYGNEPKSWVRGDWDGQLRKLPQLLQLK